jgi:hypothetical protein
MKRTLLALTLALATVAVAACDDRDSDDTAPGAAGGIERSFAMGFSSLPAELTEQSYADAFELAAGAGEVILIQRTPPWEELLEGGVSSDTAGTTEREVALADEHGLDIFFAIDPIETTERGSEIAGLPADLRGSGFADERVRQAFVEYAQYVALNYKPRYLALGVEVNSYERQNPEDFGQFVSLYTEAYDAVKEQSPDTLTFVTFQLEDMTGRLPGEETQPSQWHIINSFEPKLDVLAVSTYPSRVFESPSDIPSDYYRQLTAHTDKPVAVSEMGYATEPDQNGSESAGELLQAAFLDRVLDDAERLDMLLTVWFVRQDPKFTGDPAVTSLLQHIGLLRTDGSEKAAWSLWKDAVERPLTTEQALSN